MASVASLVEVGSFRIGSVEIRPGTREVIGPGGTEVIEPRVMQVLVVLAKAKGEIVTRNALVERCWKGRAVSEDAISRTIQRLRRLSKGAAAGSFTIKTVHKVGYRLLPADNDVALEKDALVRASEQRQQLSRRHWLIGAAAVVGTGGAAMLLRDPGRRRADELVGQADQVARGGMPDTDARAAALLEQAVKLAADHAEAWGKLALARYYRSEFAPPPQATPLVAGVQEASRRALALDPRQPDAHAALALLPPYFGDWYAAEQRMKRVLAIEPGHLPTRDAIDFMYTTVGRIREGCGDRVKMAAKDPLHATYQFKLIFALWLLGRLPEMDRAADRALQLWPRHPGIYMARFYTYALTGRPERALDQLNSLAANPGMPPPLIAAVRAAAEALASRRPADVEAASRMLVGSVEHASHAATNAVTLLTGLGEIDRAFAVSEAYLLERGPLMASVRWREQGLPFRDQRRRNTIMLFIPPAAGMRSDPRFARPVEDVGLASYWRQARVTPDYLA
ncbi:winged helix-turn-helix domain-containing protein [Sphingomonas sp.]|jgi:DNA-binding winged helix-turn-helix (wHTH) protein|uniref:winged helix-turn-helix domain-containing protein n=1 Tax=Sphingomonas sp. TaxID=28214 RepID=UPI002DF648D6|nr:winged helix-turn-helix domain-containing protein [Sphingomonas sp.]HEV2567060.1 winged helix-turn-helix domain-containing protein [Sphingomonas sp.]